MNPSNLACERTLKIDITLYQVGIIFYRVQKNCYGGECKIFRFSCLSIKHTKMISSKQTSDQEKKKLFWLHVACFFGGDGGGFFCLFVCLFFYVFLFVDYLFLHIPQSFANDEHAQLSLSW